MISIELNTISNEPNQLLYKLTFYLNTGTITVQGIKFRLFAEHFVSLKKILSLILENCGISESDKQHTCSESEISDTDSDLNETIVQDDTKPKSVDTTVVSTSPKEHDTLVESAEEHDTLVKSSEDHNIFIQHTERLELRLSESLASVQKNQLQIIDSVKNVKATVDSVQQALSKPDKNRDVNNNEQLMTKIQALQTENSQLKTEVKCEKSNLALLQAQYEKSLQHEQDMHAKTRSELQKLIQTSVDETDFTSRLLDTKNEEINKLSSSVKDLAHKVDLLSDENLSLRSQLASSLDEHMKYTLQSKTEKSTQNSSKPSVYLLGTSNVKGIDSDKITGAANVTKFITYTISEAKNKITELDIPPSAVVLHILTNDLKNMEPATCVSEICTLLAVTQQKWPNVKCIVSLATPRADDIKHHTNGLVINAYLKQKLCDQENVLLADHSNMLVGGGVNHDLLEADKFHLNSKGTSILASNLKKMIHACLSIDIPQRRGRSRSRNPNRGAQQKTVGRGRGRGLMNVVIP